MIGTFLWRRNGGIWQRQRNLITTEGRDWWTAQAVAAPGQLYCALFGNNVTPALGWTGATFPGTAGELMNAPEGYAETVRQAWGPSSWFQGALDANNFVDATLETGPVTEVNIAYSIVPVAYAPMSFRIKTATTINVYGFGMLSGNVKGAVGDTLFSALRFASAPEVYVNGDLLEVYYSLKHENV